MYKILVADDEQIALSILEEELSDQGYEVFTATDGQRASELIQAHEFDLAVLDVVMPYKDGFELTEEIKRISRNTLIILITAHASIESAVDAIKMGANDYLDKPYDINLLLQKMKSLLSLKKTSKKQREFLTGSSQSITKVEEMIAKVANVNTTILITGESGTGKGVIAKALHHSGNRRELPFIHLDCASLTNNLIESELFGYERGAFTGAEKMKKGKFELAAKGIIFLDEIGTLPLSLQTKLLTVLQDKMFYRIGGDEKIPMNARVIAATNENIEEMVQRGIFREDLFYRLNVIRIEVPPLRVRKEDIAVLAADFILEFSQDMGKEIEEIENNFFESLSLYNWPGNVRELENAMESSVALCDGPVLKRSDIPQKIYEQIYRNKDYDESNNYIRQSVKNQEILTILYALDKFDGHREKTAKYLGISRRSLQYRLKKYNLLNNH